MKKKEFIIEQLKIFTPEIAETIRSLTKQIGKNYKALTDQDIEDMLASASNHLIVARSNNDQIVAMITLLVFRIPYVKKGYLDDLIVDEGFRGRGLGALLLEKACAIAKKKGVAYVDLTARPRRVAGESLYKKFGFKKRDTNVYRLIYSYEEV